MTTKERRSRLADRPSYPEAGPPCQADVVRFRISAEKSAFAALRRQLQKLQYHGTPNIRTRSTIHLVVTPALLELARQLEKYGQFVGTYPQASMLATAKAVQAAAR